jgi:hypothetical protein
MSHTNDLVKIAEWKKIIQDKLMPKIIECNTVLEGNIYSLHTTTNYYEYFLSKQKNIYLCGNNLKQNSEILEIGFNSGFSALLLLLSSHPSVKITCVDINCHNYTIPCFEIIKELFPNRIEILLGSSVDVLPKLTNKYDLIHIDGCHLTEIAEIDIKNSLTLINNNGILIMDDVDIIDLDILWNKYVNNYKLIDTDFEIHNCKFHSIKKYVA